MFQDHRQSPLEALLNTFGTCHKTHSMATRYGSQDTEDIPDTQDSDPLDLVPQDHPVPEGDNVSSDEYCEETGSYHPLADLLEQIQQLKNQFASLKFNTPQYTPTEELPQLTDKLQHLNNQPPSPVKNQHIRPCRHTQAPCMQHRGDLVSP